MNIKFLLIGTSLSLIPNLTFAQCVATQDCETLGYTETSCNGDVLAIRATNTPAPVPATPAAPALPVAASMRLVPAPLATNGKTAAARNKHRMEQLASCIIATARWSALRLAIWASMSR